MSLFSAENIVIVTGASSGIGNVVAKKLIEEGASVIAIARRADKLEQLRNECAYPEHCYIETADLSEHLEDMPFFLSALKEKYGKFSGLAYCAGALLFKPAASIEYKESLDLFNINYFVPVMMTKTFLDKRLCIGRGASAVAIASADAFLKEKSLSVYSGTKAALQATLSTIAKEVATRGMRVNTVSPSDIKTPMTMNENMLTLRQGREANYPLGFGEPKDVAELVVFLLSQKSKWLTGHDYIADCATF